MARHRKRTRNADTVVINSSSNTSEASEDSAPGSDIDSPSKAGGYAAENDMSERQTRKINSGSFGMFNRPILTLPTSRTPDSRKKRRRVKEVGEFEQSSRSGKNRGRQHSMPGAFVIIIDESESDEALYDGLTPERAQKAKEYIQALKLVEAADKRLQKAETKSNAVITEHTTLSFKLVTLDATADNKISDIVRERDEAIEIATENAEAEIQRIRERLPAKKESYEGQLQACVERKNEIEEHVVEARAEIEAARENKSELERQGGFELCSDVRMVQARKISKCR